MRRTLGGGAPSPGIRARALALIEDTLSVPDESTALAPVRCGRVRRNNKKMAGIHCSD
jgi:hypothetical protein